MALYFTPPHRGHFVSPADPEIPESMTQPMLSITPFQPQPPNLWKRDDLDGLLHEEQPPEMGIDTKWFQGGAMYGPLDQADIDLITNSGYGAYLHTSPTPPEP